MRNSLLIAGAIILAALLVLLGWWARGVVEAYNAWLNDPIVIDGDPLPPLDPCPAGYWVVLPGDTLWDIARYCYPGDHTGRRVDEILRANPGLDPGRLRVGQVLRLPVATEIAGGAE